jgi:hypothetical protein
MFAARHYLLMLLAASSWLGAAVAARASSIYEPNNLPNKSFALPSKQFVVSDDLNGTAGRPLTLLAQYNPTYAAQLAMGSPLPGEWNNGGSQLFDVPLAANGMAFFRITGAPDGSFVGTHTQNGKYSITYKVFNPADQLVKTVTQFEWVTPGMVDNAWLPPDVSIPNWTGYKTDVVVNNVVGPGSGDSLDFFTFSGLGANMPFTARLTNFDFDAMIGLYNGNTLGTTGTLIDGVPTLTGVADSAGKVKIGITGMGDTSFVGAHTEVGQYTLQVFPIPEPSTGALLGGGGAVWLLLGKRARRQRRRAARAQGSWWASTEASASAGGCSSSSRASRSSGSSGGV